MATNISKYVQLNDFLLLEYEFNKNPSDLISCENPCLAETRFGERQYFTLNGLGTTNNMLSLQSIAMSSNKSQWYVNPSDISSYYQVFDSSELISQSLYRHDTVKLHIVSGYNFDDIAGFLLQIKADRSVPEIDSITLSGTSGTADISCNGFTALATYDPSGLTQTAESFVSSWTTSFALVGVALSSSDNTLFLTSIDGVPFGSRANISNVSGDLSGTASLLQVANAKLVDTTLSNFTWIKQIRGNDVIKFAVEPLYLGNRFYDKYVEFRIPCVQSLGGASSPGIEEILKINTLSDVYIQYSTIPEIDNYQYVISEKIQLQLPVQSNAELFNCFIAESTAGDYIEYYATWNNTIIGEYMGDIESGRIPLFTSNNPNDNYQEFAEEYGAEAAKWVLIHEIQVTEHIPGATLMTQRLQFTQESNFMTPNKFRPIIINSDIASSYNIEYICRLMNRMDGSQIIRKASFSSTDPKKYGRTFTRINIDNYIPYKVFNKIPGEVANIVSGAGPQKTKYVKVFYDTTNVVLNMNNEVLPQGTGPLFLKDGDSAYMFKFERLNQNTDPIQRENVDLAGVYNYALSFTLDDKTKIEVNPTYSTNMNTSLGQLEFKLMADQVVKLLSQTNNGYSIIIKNSDGTQYIFYEGLFFSYRDYDQAVLQYQEIYDVNGLNSKIADLETQVKSLQEENAALKANQ